MSEVIVIQDTGLGTAFVLTTQLLVKSFSFNLKVQMLLQPSTPHGGESTYTPSRV